MDRNVKDYPARLSELVRYAHEAYGIRPDDTALLAGLTLRSVYPGEWVIVESSAHHFWDHLTDVMWEHRMKFGQLTVRSQKAWEANNYIEGVLRERRLTHFWLDIYGGDLWRRNSPYKNSRYGELEAECIRVRVEVEPRVCPPNCAGLREVLNRVWDMEHRRILPEPFPPSPTFTAYVKALQRLNPMLNNGRALVDNLSLIPGRMAALRGRKTLLADDHRACRRVMRESVRQWTGDLLEPLLGGIPCDIGDFLASGIGFIPGDTIRVLLRELVESGALAETRYKGRKAWRWGAEWGPDCQALLIGDAQWWVEEGWEGEGENGR